MSYKEKVVLQLITDVTTEKFSKYDVLAKQTFRKRDGTDWDKFWLFEFGGTSKQFVEGFEVGQTVEVSFDVQCRPTEWMDKNGQKQSKVFVSLQGKGVYPINNGTTPEVANHNANYNPETRMPYGSTSVDDATHIVDDEQSLPF